MVHDYLFNGEEPYLTERGSNVSDVQSCWSMDNNRGCVCVEHRMICIGKERRKYHAEHVLNVVVSRTFSPLSHSFTLFAS